MLGTLTKSTCTPLKRLILRAQIELSRSCHRDDLSNNWVNDPVGTELRVYCLLEADKMAANARNRAAKEFTTYRVPLA